VATLTATSFTTTFAFGVHSLDGTTTGLQHVGFGTVFTFGSAGIAGSLQAASFQTTFAFGQSTLLQASEPVLFTIAGVNKTSLINPDSVTITNTIDGKGSMSFTLVDQSYAYRPAIGQEVRFVLEGVLEFAGLVSDVIEGHITGTSPVNPTSQPQVQCVDFASILDRRILIQEFAATATAKEMVQSVVDTTLSQDGITFDDTDGDPGVIDERSFRGVTGTDFMQRVSRASTPGYSWSVDYLRTLRFFDPTAGVGAAPVSVTDNDGNVLDAAATGGSTLNVREFQGNYRNVQYVRLAKPSGVLFGEEAVSAPGTSPSNWGPLLVSNPIQENASISIKLVGSTGTIDPGIIITQAEYDRRKALNQYNTSPWDYKYTPGSNVLENNKNSTSFFPNPGNIGSRVQVVLSYATGEATNAIISVQNDTEIAARQAIEGGSGRYESLEEVNDIETIQAGEDLASALLDRYASMPKEIRFSTAVMGWEPGQLLTSTITKPPATDTFLIESVTKSSSHGGLSIDHPDTGQRWLISTIQGVNGAALDSREEIRRRIIDRDRPSRPRSHSEHRFMSGGSITGQTNNGLDSIVVPSGGGTVTASSTAVTGTDTTFETDLAVGDQIHILDTAGSQVRTIDAITNDTALTVSAAFSPAIATASNYRKVVESETKAEITQDGPIASVSAVYNEPPTGATDATGTKRVQIDVLKNTTAAPTVFTSIIPGTTKLILPSGIGANVSGSVNLSVEALKGEALRVDVWDANSDTAVRGGVVTVHQFV
jgi:hypothetical protein